MADKKAETTKKVATSDTDRIAEIVKENARRRELRIFHEELNRRLDIAKNGRIAYERKDFIVAIRDYKKFLSITARAYQVELKDLHPKLFAEKMRPTEAILVSSIAFDLIKIYDHLSTPEATAERALFFKLLINFTKGMPAQNFMAIGLERYINYTHGIKHKKEFEAAWKAIGGGKSCFVATAVYENEDAKELIVLRKFRDDVLMQSTIGVRLVAIYYRLGPSLAAFVRKNLIIKKWVKIFLDAVIKRL